MRLIAACALVAVVTACARLQSTELVGTASAALIVESERLTGADLPAKHLVFTFDDGPSLTTTALSTYLAAHGIHATFFVDGSCIATTTLLTPHCAAPVPGATTMLEDVTKAGHLIGNHTTTGRDLVSEVPANHIAQELAETDALVASLVPWNKKLFRAPHGSWSGAGADADAVYDTLKSTALNGYLGPFYWNIGGGPTDATHASDTDCWTLGYTSSQCGDLYLHEIHARGSGIVLFHDVAETVNLVKYIVPLLESEGFTFDPIDASPAVTAIEPTCDSSCLACTGPSATACTSCSPGSRLVSGGCLACTVCPPGTFTAQTCSALVDTQCTACPAGTFQSDAGAIACPVCGDCNDNDACTTDTCGGILGCTHTKIPNCPMFDGGPIVVPPDVDASVPRTGGKIDDDNNAVAVDDSSDGGGCSSTTRHGSSERALIALWMTLGFTLAVHRRRTKRPLSSKE